MGSYRELYFYLFGQIEDALEDLDRDDVDRARARLIRAQRRAEEDAISLDLFPETAVTEDGSSVS